MEYLDKLIQSMYYFNLFSKTACFNYLEDFKVIGVFTL